MLVYVYNFLSAHFSFVGTLTLAIILCLPFIKKIDMYTLLSVFIDYIYLLFLFLSTASLLLHSGFL